MPTDLQEQEQPTSQPDAPVQGQQDAPQEEPAPPQYLWNEDMDEDLQNVLLKLDEHYANEFKYPRRLEVMNAWRARSFWNELQHLTWNWDGDCWDVLGPAGAGGQGQDSKDKERDSAVLYCTNIYQGFGESFIAIMTQAVPNLRFEPEDAEEAADIETAAEGDNLRKLVQHENDPIKLMTKASFIAWTDGRMHGYTWWGENPRTQKEQECQEVVGVMEVKVPVIYEGISEYPYVRYAYEYHLAKARTKVKKREFPDPNYWKKIKSGGKGNGQDMFERTARISAKQGVSFKSAGGDAYGSLVTCIRTWLRPDCFMEDCVPEDKRDELLALFPHGCLLEQDNGLYTGSRDECMDDHWTVENIMEGTGANRPAKGTCLISVQERSNDTINSAQDIYDKTIPASHWDDKVFDVDAMNDQAAQAGARYGVDFSGIEEGGNLESHVFFEPEATVSADMLTYLKELMTDIPEFLTGISAILFGSDSQGDKSGKALSIQQAAAMGRIGLPFRVLKRFYAGMMEQAVRLSIEMRSEDVSLSVPDEQGEMEKLSIAFGGLNGKIRCYAQQDENYPESYISKRNTWMQLVAMGVQDPVLGAILKDPMNQNLAKKLIGLTEFNIPDAQSWNKQTREIAILLASLPALVTPAPAQVPNPAVPEITETIQPPDEMESSVPIDEEYDNHQAEYLTVVLYVNSSKGQRKKKEDPAGFENVRLHGLEHKAIIQKQMLQQAMAAAQAQAGPQPPDKGKDGSGGKDNESKGAGEASPPKTSAPDMAHAA